MCNLFHYLVEKILLIRLFFHKAEYYSARSGIFLCLVISRVELIRKDKEKFRSVRKIPPSGKQALEKTKRNSAPCEKFRLVENQL